MKQKILSLLFFCSLVLSSSCLPGGQSNKGGRTITVYGFSIMKKALEKEIYPAFAAKWKAEHGEARSHCDMETRRFIAELNI